MHTKKFDITLKSVKRFLERDANLNIIRILEQTHPADIAHLLRHLTTDEKKKLFRIIRSSESLAADVLSEMGEELWEELVSDLDPQETSEIVQEMESDVAADLLGSLEEEKAREILDLMEDEETASEVEKLLDYEEDTAGGIMNPEVVAADENLKVSEAFELIRKAEDFEMVFYLYVTDHHRHLLGVISLRQLIISPPNRTLREIMNPDVIYVTEDTDQEEVAKEVERYGLIAIPVVNEEHQLLGIVTVDDVIGVIREEATEDLYKMAGTDDEEITSKSSFKIARIRFPWLTATLVAGIANSYVINTYQDALHKVIALAAFIPVILGMGGNIGGQSAVIVVRGMALGKIDLEHLFKVIFKEIRVGLILGFIYGNILGLLAYFFFRSPPLLGVVVGLSICASMLIAVTIGVLYPMFFKKIGVDPAVATHPFVTTSTDLIGILIYFAIARVLLLGA
jgi:magnesium transporter